MIGRIAIYVGLVVLAVVTVLPLGQTVLSSLKPLNELIGTTSTFFPKDWTWANYADAWSRGNFANYFLNSVIITGGVVVLDTLASSMCGYVLARKRLPGQRVLEGLFMFTLFIGLTTAVLFPQYEIARRLGLNNQVGIILVEYVGIMIIHVYLIRAFLAGLGTELEEAARIDGCGFFGTYWRISFPLLRPILATTVLLGFQASWNNFQVPLVFSLAARELRTVVIGVTALKYDAPDGLTAYDTLLAGVCIASIPVVVLFIWLQRFFIRGWTEGAVKG